MYTQLLSLTDLSQSTGTQVQGSENKMNDSLKLFFFFLNDLSK